MIKSLPSSVLLGLLMMIEVLLLIVGSITKVTLVLLGRWTIRPIRTPLLMILQSLGGSEGFLVAEMT